MTRLVEAIPFWIKVALGVLLAAATLLGAVAASFRRGRNSALRRAHTDPLTGLPNRRHLEDTLERMVSHAHRRGAPLAAVLLDVDHFKRINDECGHGVGDAVLCQIGELVAPVLRGSDFFGRHGGEEFVLLLPDTTADGAAVVAEKIRVAMGALVTDGLHHPVTVSLGAAELLPGDMDGSELLGNADQALYRAKEGGRDRVEVAQASSTRELVLTH